MDGKDNRSMSVSKEGRCPRVQYLPLKEAQYSHYAPKAHSRPMMSRSSSMSMLLEEGKPWRPAGNTGSLSPSPFVPSTHVDLGPELRIVTSSIGEDHIPLISGLSGMRHLGKSMDKLIGCDGPALTSDDEKLYRMEKGLSREEADYLGCDNTLCLTAHTLLENPEFETRWYFKYFLGKMHQNYLGYDTERAPFFLSMVFADGLYRCILWQRTGSKRLNVRPGQSGKVPSLKGILEKFGFPKAGATLRELVDPAVQQELIILEEQEGAVHFKIGVLYARAGQQSDNEMFSNQNGSPEFESFLNLLGERVRLKDFPNYRGGLDNRNDSTGTHSVYTTFEGHEIMFHVSTLLPYHSENKQQVERKRHLGNDIVVIIFMDGDTHEEALAAALNLYPATAIRSQFNHIFAVVTHDAFDGSYRVCVYSEHKMPEYSPPLPVDGLFTDPKRFRDFLLAKLINGEKAAFSLPVFAEKRERTLDLLIKGVEQKFRCVNQRKTSLPAHASSASKKSAESFFTEVGQKLKVERYMKGTHPTSQRSTATKNSPWEPHLIVEDFSHPITCGDFYDDNMMVVATPADGTFLLYRDGHFSLLIDKSVPVVQLVVAHKHDLIIFRTGFTKDNYVHAVPLPFFHGRQGDKVLDKQKLSSFRVPGSRGTHCFCTTPLEEKYLRLFVAVKTKVCMLMWKHTSDCLPKKLAEMKIAEEFKMHREATLSDIPVMMTMKEEIPSGKLFVGYKNGTIEVVDEITAEAQRFLTVDSRIRNMTVTSDNRELLVGYNLSCQFCPLSDRENQQKTMDFNFYSEPEALVHVNAYILAFNWDSLEVRLAANGSLVQSLASQNIHLLSLKRDILFVTSQRLQVSSDRSQSTDHKYFSSDLSGTVGGSANSRPRSRASSVTAVPHLFYIYKISFDNLIGARTAEHLPADRTISISSNQTDDADGVSVDSGDSTLLDIPPVREGRSLSSSPDPSHNSGATVSPSRMRACMKKSLFFQNGEEDAEDVLPPTQLGSHHRGLLRTVFFQHDTSPDSGFVPEDYGQPATRRTSNLEVLPL